jgi:N-sulfoglucosamine sulfohydrolase
LPFPIANDLSNSPTWQGVLKSDNELLGKRTVKNILERPEYELYDVINDPDEIKNLASNPEYASILADLKARLKSFQVRTNDPWIIF